MEYNLTRSNRQLNYLRYLTANLSALMTFKKLASQPRVIGQLSIRWLGVCPVY